MAKRELKAVFSADNRQFLRATKTVKTTIKNVAKLSAGLATVAIGGGVQAVRRSMEFNKAMAEANTIARLGADDFAKLNAQIKELAKETGATTQELTSGLYQALSAGVPPENVIDFLRTSTKGAVAGVTTVDVAVDGLTSALNSYGMEAGKAGDVSDMFFETVRLGKTTFAELAGSIGQVAPLASQAGVSLDQLLAAYASLTKQGVKTEIATTQIRGAITALVKPSKDLETQLKATFGTASGTEVLARFGLQATLETLAQSTGNSTDALSKLFPEVRGLNGVLGLTGKNATTAALDLNFLGRATGATNTAFGTMANTASFKTGLAMTRLNVAFLELGQKLEQVLLPQLDRLNAALSDPQNQAAIANGINGIADAAIRAGKALGFAVMWYKTARDEWGKFGEDVANVLTPQMFPHMSTGERIRARIATRFGEMAGMPRLDFRSSVGAGLNFASPTYGMQQGIRLIGDILHELRGGNRGPGQGLAVTPAGGE